MHIKTWIGYRSLYDMMNSWIFNFLIENWKSNKKSNQSSLGGQTNHIGTAPWEGVTPGLKEIHHLPEVISDRVVSSGACGEARYVKKKGANLQKVKMPSLHSRLSHQTPRGDHRSRPRRWSLALLHVGSSDSCVSFRTVNTTLVTSAKHPPGGAKAEGQDEITFIGESDFRSPIQAYYCSGQEQSSRKCILSVSSVSLMPQ